MFGTAANRDVMGGSIGKCHQLVTALNQAGIRINGCDPWDIQIRHPATLKRILSGGSLALGESYMDGWWDAESVDAMITKILRAGLSPRGLNWQAVLYWVIHKLVNLQSEVRAWEVGEKHYDIGNDLYERMLDRWMAYSCGYWKQAGTLEQAQEAKLDLICRKLDLKPGMRVLDIGCGWGSWMRFAAQRYGISAVGLTISKEQLKYAGEHSAGLDLEYRLEDYRAFSRSGEQPFDRVVSVGMFEHVGLKNYHDYFSVARQSLKNDGIFLLHTIGFVASGQRANPWIRKYIFPNGVLPSAAEISRTVEPHFIIEDWHNFGRDYDATLMAWLARFDDAWPDPAKRYDERFRRMWRYYLMSCAAAFRSRQCQLWQLVLSPNGLEAGYRRPE